MMVNQETGQITQQINKKDSKFMFMNKDTFEKAKPEDIESGTAKAQKWEWDDFQRLADHNKKTGEGPTDPQKLLVEHDFEMQVANLKGNEGQTAEILGNLEENIGVYRDAAEKGEILNPRTGETRKLSEAEQDEYKTRVETTSKRIAGLKASLQASNEQIEELEDKQKKYKTFNEFGLRKSLDSYSEAGIWAMQESEKNKYVQKGKGSLRVGPEMGWPDYYGSHPKEWVELIRKSREAMVEKLTQKKVEDSSTQKMVDNPYYNPDMTVAQAKEEAKQHIKGEIDTSHLGMWIQNFKQELPWDQRVKEFKKWYKGQIDFLAEENKKHDLIGSVQVVDSASGAHGHLPAGQGILGKDIFDYMKTLKTKGGYKGDFTAEGHEEEKFNQGRIMTKTWQALGSPIGSGYFAGRPAPAFSDIQHSYAMSAYGSTGIFQSYVPSNDFTLWSNVPFE